MTILFIDPEHDRVALDPSAGPRHRARVAIATERIAAAAGRRCAVLRYSDVSPSLVEQIAPAAMAIGGCTTDWAEYDRAELDGLLATIRAGAVPTLGICAGHQLIGLAHGAPWGPLGPLVVGEVDPDPCFAPGQRKQRGFLPVEVDEGCVLFRGLGPAPVFFQTHYWHLEDVPAGFILRASSTWSPIQAIERIDRPVFGVQFHTERFSEIYPAGETVLRNFFRAVAGSEPLRSHSSTAAS